MKFGLKKACKDCPFRKDKKYLNASRAREIASVVTQDGSFSCHKTVDYSDEDYEETLRDDEHFCAGALLFLENTQGVYSNLLLRLAKMMEGFDPSQLQGHDEVYASLEDMVAGHGGDK